MSEDRNELGPALLVFTQRLAETERKPTSQSHKGDQRYERLLREEDTMLSFKELTMLVSVLDNEILEAARFEKAFPKSDQFKVARLHDA